VPIEDVAGFGSKDVEFASENGCIVRCRHETDDTWRAKLCAMRAAPTSAGHEAFRWTCNRYPDLWRVVQKRACSR
jgi:hypothetical protein